MTPYMTCSGAVVGCRVRVGPKQTLQRRIPYSGHLLARQVFRQLGVREFLPSQESLTTLSGLTCTATPVICVDAFASVTGYNTANLNLTRVPLYLKYLPAGAQSIDISVTESQPSVRPILSYEMSCSQCIRVFAVNFRSW